MQVSFLTESEIAALPVPIQSRITLHNNKRMRSSLPILEMNKCIQKFQDNPAHDFGTRELNEEVAKAAKKEKERISNSTAAQNAALRKESHSKFSELIAEDRIAVEENRNPKTLRTYLITAIKGTSLEDVNNALTLGAEINSKKNSAWHQNIQTPLQAAVVTSKCDEIIAVLLRKGADVSIVNHENKNVFHLAENKASYLELLHEHVRLH